LTENQLTAAVSTIGILFMLWLLNTILPQNAGGALGVIIDSLSLYQQFENFQTGVLDASSVLYFLAMTFLFLFLTVRTIEKKKRSRE
jgi:ABC-2 type transport system permease protein